MQSVALWEVRLNILKSDDKGPLRLSQKAVEFVLWATGGPEGVVCELLVSVSPISGLSSNLPCFLFSFFLPPPLFFFFSSSSFSSVLSIRIILLVAVW